MANTDRERVIGAWPNVAIQNPTAKTPAHQHLVDFPK